MAVTVLTRDEVHSMLETKLKTDEFRIVSVEESVPGIRLGFLADYAFISFEVQTPTPKNSEKVVKFSTFVKRLPANSNCREVAEDGLFKKEQIFYSVVAKDFNTILVKDIPYPPAYLVKSELIVMEDMRRHGYAGVCSTREPVDRQHCEKALAAIARFHSASIISERSSKRSLREVYPEAMFENVFSEEVKFSRFVHFGLISAHDLVPHMPEYKGKDPTVIKAVQEKIMRFVEQVMGFIERNGDTLHVMCHGDPWISNFIFKYEDNVPTKALLIDFQMLRYAPPAFDVLLFLYKSLEFGETRPQQILEFKRFYYDCLARELLAADISIESVLTWDEFQRSCKVYDVLLSAVAVVYCQTCDVPHDFIDKIFSNQELYDKYISQNRSEQVRAFYETDEHFKRVFHHTVLEFISHL